MIILFRTILTRVAVSGFFGAWLTAAVFRQISPQADFVRRFDPFNFYIPVFRFFGPNPGSTDTHVLVRSKRRDGTLEPWQEVVTGQSKRRWRHTVWYPERRLGKAVLDLGKSLQNSSQLDYRRLHKTVTYRALLNTVKFGITHRPDAVSVQFAVARSAAYDPDYPPELMFVSEFHELEKRPPGTPAMIGLRK